MRNRILIVVLGVSLGLIAKIGVSLYEDWRRASKPAPAGAPEKSGKQSVASPSK